MSWQRVDRVIAAAVSAGAVPGVVLLVASGDEVLLERAWGRLAEKRAEASVDTIYDLASLTKPLVTLPCLLLLVAEGRVRFDDPVAEHLPAFARGEPARAQVRVRELLGHRSGLPAWRPYYERVSPSEGRGLGPPAGSREARELVVRLALAEPLERVPGSSAVYSDVGFIVLTSLIEAVARMRLDEFAAKRLFGPLGLETAVFSELDDPASRPPLERTAPCGRSPWREAAVHGVASDDNAFAMGGVAGHAGLFGTARDVLTLAGEQMRASAGGASLLEAELVNECWRPPPLPPGAQPSSWRLGWDSPSPGRSSAGKHISTRAVGHLGWSGASVWLDLERDLEVVLLTNRLEPDWTNRAIAELRPRVHDAVFEDLGL